MGRKVFRGELDDQQREVFARIIEAKTRREIAVSLGVTPALVEAIIRRTCRQLGTSSRHEAARMIGTHYGCIPLPASLPDRTKGVHSCVAVGASDDFLTSKMVQTEHALQSQSGYVRDVGNQVMQKDEKAGVYSEVAGRMGVSKIVAASSMAERVLLLSLLIASSALALGALVSAMQGFDTLFFS